MEDIERWLKNHGLEKHSEVFIENEIDLDVLDELTMDELKELEIPLGARKRILKAIAAGTAARSSEEPTSSEPAATASREAERRQLTVMFCDLVGPTSLSESMDPEDYRDIISAYQTAASDIVAEHDGYLARFMGDGLLIYFGYPNAHENDPEQATRAGQSKRTIEADCAAPRLTFSVIVRSKQYSFRFIATGGSRCRGGLARARMATRAVLRRPGGSA